MGGEGGRRGVGAGKKDESFVWVRGGLFILSEARVL